MSTKWTIDDENGVQPAPVPRMTVLATMAMLSNAAGERAAAEGYLLELLANVAFRNEPARENAS